MKEKYHVNESWIFFVAKKNNIPRTFNRGKTYWSKRHIDAYFAKKAPNPDIAGWYSTQEMQKKFGMTLSAIYCFVSKNAIPKKKERMAQFKAGDVVEGTVDSIKPYGAFIKLDDGVDGLLDNNPDTRRCDYSESLSDELLLLYMCVTYCLIFRWARS